MTTPDMSMVRLVARALRQKLDDDGASMVDRDGGAYSHVDATITWADLARAAIQAMREPTEAMCAVSDRMAGSELCDNATPGEAAIVFTAMIDAALNEKAG